eukprot:1153345-Pelagomonas_calceolata.AAC.10
MRYMGIRKVTSSTLCLTLVLKPGLLESESGARRLISVLDRMSMKFQIQLGGLQSVKTKLVKGLQSVGCLGDPTHQ